MNKQKLVNILIKELDYQRNIFGNYKNDPKMNVASLIIIIEEYLKKAKKAYITDWTKKLPKWMLDCKERGNNDLSPLPAPVKTYEEIIKVFALSGSLLESFTDLNPEYWRENGIKDKWNKELKNDK